MQEGLSFGKLIKKIVRVNGVDCATRQPPNLVLLPA